jgi:hypothetical protein
MVFRPVPVLLLCAVLVPGAIGLAGRTALAYPRYSDGTGLTYCAQCHESAVGGFFNQGSLHDAHTAKATYVCLLCHKQIGDIPEMATSGAPDGKGCLGCHGQVGNGVLSGAGLRARHVARGLVDSDGFDCNACHDINPVPPESLAPPYYGRPDVVQTGPCNTDGSEDFWSWLTGQPDGRGLDNDGDLKIDAADPDCHDSCADHDGDGYGDPGDPWCANGAERDCDDTHVTVHPGAPEIFDGLDNDCNGDIDEIKNDGFSTPAQRNRYSWDQQLPAGQVYDVLRSDGAAFPAASQNTTCLANNTPALFVDDAAGVPLRKCFYYLVRNNLVSDYGRRSDGSPRDFLTCP